MTSDEPGDRGKRKTRGERVAVVGSLLGAFVTAIGAISSVFFTNATLREAEQGQITERYGKSVEQLGSTDIYVRIGGIFALERLSHDSRPDQPTIVEVLSAFVEGRATRAAAPSCAETIRTEAEIPLDIRAAIKALARRDPTSDGDAHVQLPGLCLPGLGAGRASLRAAQLANSNLTAADLGRADLRDANLTSAVVGCRTEVVSPTCSVLERADLSGASLTDADLTGANLLGAQLGGAVLVRARLAGANLIQVNLRGGHAVNVALSSATAQDASFAGAEMANAHLDHAQLSGSDFTGTDLSAADLSNATMLSARLHRAVLRGANLTGALLIGADLSGATLAGARLSGADLSYANITGADLTGVDLSSVRLLGAIGVPPR